MIYGKSRNVVVIQNIDSSYVEQAILILKKNPGDKEFFASEEGIVVEAQRIIEKYNQNMNAPKKATFRRLWGYLFIVAAAIASCLFYHFS